MKTPILFRDQLLQCMRTGMVGEGPLKTFEEHPELLPLFPSKKFAKAIMSGELKGFALNLCMKFGGECYGGNVECRKMRGIE